MVNWKEMEKLHVISKLEEILGKWYHCDLLFCDSSGHIHSKHFEDQAEFRSHFFKVFLEQDNAQETFIQDIEKLNTQIVMSDAAYFVFETSIAKVKALACPVILEGEYVGSVITWPFVDETITSSEIKSIEKNLISFGIDQSDAEIAVKNLSRLATRDFDHFSELVLLVASEIKMFSTEIASREQRIQELNSELGNKYRYHMMIGKSKQMQQIYALLEKISNSESSVFIQGENGTGKELVAKAVHFHSPRKDKVFLAVNCSAFNDNLLDSELFGHVKGSFTGAVKDKKGLFEMADGGTLFLDEIGDTSLSMQVKLLRVLQEGTFMPVGGTTPKKADVRIIVATNRNIKEMMHKGEFREDLFYRINVMSIVVPPLRERKEDLSLLIDHFLSKQCKERNIALKSLSKKCMEKMLDYAWPGNVRELENEIERIVVLAGEEKTINPDVLSSRILDFGSAAAEGKGVINTSGSLKDALEELEMLMIKEGLKRCNFNKSKLSKELGISRASLIMKVEKYELDKRALNKKAA